MTDHGHDDKKLLLTIGGLVVAGVAGIALIATQTLDGSTEPVAQRSTERQADKAMDTSRSSSSYGTPDAVEQGPIAASFNTPAAEPVMPVDSTSIEIEPIEVAEVPFQIDPSLDPLKEGQRRYAMKEYEEAVAYLTAAVDAKDASWTRYMLGLAEWKSGDLDAARDSLRQAGEANAHTLRPWINLARVENERNDFDAALAAVEKAGEVDPDDARVHFLRGRTLRNMGQTDQALNALQTSWALDSENGYTANLIGLMLIDKGEFAEAETYLQQAVRFAPSVAFVHNNLGVSLERQDRAVDAAAAYQVALDLNPNSEKARVSLARLEPFLPTVSESTPDPVVIVDGGADEAEESGSEIAQVESEVETVGESGDSSPIEGSEVEPTEVSTLEPVTDADDAEVESGADTSN